MSTVIPLTAKRRVVVSIQMVMALLMLKNAFPNDPSETGDFDGDGVGDNADAFPTDPTRSEPDGADSWTGIQGYWDFLERRG